MKVLITIIVSVFAFSVAGAQTASGALTGPEATPAASKNHDEETSEARNVEDHISQLRNELKITAAEEPQWDSVAKTMRENAEEIDQAIDKRDTTINTATAVENLNSYADVVQTHAAAVKKLAHSFSALYAEMSDSQKRMADEIFAHRHHARTAAKRPAAKS